MTTKTDTSYHVGRTATCLDRIYRRLLEVETATGRKKTPGRLAQLYDGDDLSGWDSADHDAAQCCGVHLTDVINRAHRAIDEMLKEWVA